MDTDAPLRLSFDRFELDEANARLVREGVAVPVPPKAFGVLCALVRRHGQLVTKNQLLDAVWGHRYVSDSVLKTTISELRGALADDARAPRYVETAARRGYRFIAPMATPAAVAAPAAQVFAAPPPPSLVGRRAELDRLVGLWAAAGMGQRQVCWIAGEAGIGKTTVIEALLATLGTVAHAHGQCIEQFGAAEPYLPVLDALASLCRLDASLVGLLRSTAPTWLLQLPWLTTPAEHEQLRANLASVSQDRMLREFSELVERYTATRPLLLITEDLHWCDDATVRLIEHVARRRANARLLWIGTFRVAELVATSHPLGGLRHELRARHLATELLLEPFSETELAQYLAGRMPAAAREEALVQRIHRQTDGLPLFVANVVEELGTNGAAPRTVPESLAGVIERQIQRLPPELAQLLQAAAVCGVQFGVTLLAQVFGDDPQAVAARCDALVRGQYWIAPVSVAAQADGSLDVQHAFRHALYREVFYERIGAAERAGLHRRVAQALSARRDKGAQGSAAELAMHCERGLDPLGALQAYAAAAENALRCFAPIEALQLATHALALVPQTPESVQRLELELALAHLAAAAHAQSSGISSEAAHAAFERAGELAELLPASPRRAWVLTGMAWMCTAHGDFKPALAFARRLREVAEAATDPVVRATAWCVNAIPLLQLGEFGEAEVLVEGSLALTENDDPGRLHVAAVLDPGVTSRGVAATLNAHRGRIALAERHMQAAIQRALAIGQPISRGFSLRCAGMVLLRIDDPQRLHGIASTMAEMVRAHGLNQGHGPSQCLLGYAEARLGDAAAGHRRVVAACETFEAAGVRFDLSLFWRLAADAAWLAGDADAAAKHVERGLAVAARTGERLHVPDLLLLRARLEAPEAARATLREAVANAQALGAVIAELEARCAVCRLPGATPRELAALRKLRAQIEAPEPIAPLQRADELLAAAARG